MLPKEKDIYNHWNFSGSFKCGKDKRELAKNVFLRKATISLEANKLFATPNARGWMCLIFKSHSLFLVQYGVALILDCVCKRGNRRLVNLG